MKKVVVILFILIALESGGFAQAKTTDPLRKLKQSLGSTYSPAYLMKALSIQQFSMNHYFSTSLMMGGGQSILMNAYMNRMTFDFKIPLKVQLDVGVMSFPFSSGDQIGSIGNQFFGNLKMQYQPFKNMIIGLQLYKGPMLYYPYGAYPDSFRPANYFFSN